MSLSCLTIKNIVLIEHLSINFHDGLGALTGETGAGKSILLDSLGLALGARSESRLVKSGANKASVSAEFDLPPNHPIFDLFRDPDLDLDIDPSEPLILRRSLNSDGRSRASINDQPVSIKTLQKIGANLVEIHGQNDTHGLLDPSTHIHMLDAYAGLSLALSKPWLDYKSTRKALEKARQDISKSKSEEEFLRTAIDDIDTLAPTQGEEENLSTLKESLKHRERVLEGLNAAYYALNNDEYDPIATASGSLTRIADKLGSAGDEIFSALDRATDAIEEIRSSVQTLCADLNDETHDLETIDERLYALRKEARKHNCAVDDLITIRENLAQQLNAIEHADDLIAELSIKADQAKQAYIKAAQNISSKRKIAAKKLDQLVKHELEPLKLGKAKFTTTVTPLDEQYWGENGLDKVEFLVATNPGQEQGPIGKIASGGEMSRFMLSLKFVMPKTSTIRTMIFDEVDTGIGGSTADAVGQRLARLGLDNQVLVVTHAPQVAAKANHHYVVEKQSTGNVTTTHIEYLHNENQRENEIARMLAGETITSEALAAAKSLLNASQKQNAT